MRSDPGQQDTAATIKYKTRWVRTSRKPIFANTVVDTGPVAATLTAFPSAPVLTGSSLLVEAAMSYPMVWNAEYDMKVDVAIANAAVSILYHHADCFADLITDWSTPAAVAWPWLSHPKLLDDPKYFVPYKYTYKFALRVRSLPLIGFRFESSNTMACGVWMSWFLRLQDLYLTLNANKDNVVDVFGSPACNTHVVFSVPTFTTNIVKRVTEYDAPSSSVQFAISAEGVTHAGDPDHVENLSRAAAVPPAAQCRVILTLPSSHPKSILLPVGSYAEEFLTFGKLTWSGTYTYATPCFDPKVTDCVSMNLGILDPVGVLSAEVLDACLRVR